MFPQYRLVGYAGLTGAPSAGSDRSARPAGRRAGRRARAVPPGRPPARALLLLDIQPGRAEFLVEAKAYQRWLREPDVGVALDPSGRWTRGTGRVFGHTTGAGSTGPAYLSRLVAAPPAGEGPGYHQLAPGIVRRESGLKPHRGVAVVKSVDGIGSRGAKENTYRQVNKTTPSFVRPAFKLFFDEDRKSGRLIAPAQVLALRPRPDYVRLRVAVRCDD